MNIILTPNRRLAATLLKEQQVKHIAEGKKCWLTDNILPITSWQQQLWREYTLNQIKSLPLLLNSNQVLILWEETIRKHQGDNYLLQVPQTAEIAKSAWETLQQWQVDLDHPAFVTTEDSNIFCKWAKQFASLCQKKNWIDSPSMINRLINLVSSGDITLPQKIILHGFTELSPQQRSFLKACDARGVELGYPASSKQYKPCAKKISLLNQDAEIRTMARWAKATYASDPNIRIGCIVPQLEEIRDRVIAIFSEIFSEQDRYSLSYIHYPFNVSAGKSLSTYPVISIALDMLAFLSNNITLDKFSLMLRSPFIGEAEREMVMRAHFDARIKRTHRKKISLTDLFLANDLKSLCPLLAARLEHYLASPPPLSRLLPSQWVIYFSDKLTQMGWPGERSLNSQEYQVVQRFLDLLHEYAGLDEILGAQSQTEALHYLNRFTCKTVFQPQTPEAPIQILGVLEAADLPFDHLWIMGLEDNMWPPTPKPNPFIPQQLQKRLQMPHATAERELIYCQRLIEQFEQSAKHLIFSYPLHNDDLELRVSPLIANLPSIQEAELLLAQDYLISHHIFQSKQLESLLDHIAPAISTEETIRGGATIFKLQAACPFRAFAELRLHARKPEILNIGLRPQDRGNIIHKALELIWLQLGDSERLALIEPNELQHIIAHSAEIAISEITGQSLASSRYLRLESQRLQKLLNEWLNKEKLRPPFRVIAQEQQYTLHLGKISAKVRIDRIDEEPNGKQWIIDYKTGKNASIYSWFGERPDEPQLPLYCLINPDHTIGLLFAQLHPENMALKGVSATPTEINSINAIADIDATEATCWQEQIALWQTTLESLANSFQEGRAIPNPKYSDATCQSCHLQSLCRRYEDPSKQDY